MKRINHSTKTTWEKETAYSRAVKYGNHIVVSGTTAVDESGEIQHPGDAEQQAIFIFKKIEKALQALGATMQNVIRTRAFITDIQQYESFSKAHHQFFKGITPACTLVEVSALVHPGLVIEIEVDAML